MKYVQFDEYKRYRNLSAKEELDLFSDLNQENRNIIIQSHLKLVLYIAKKYENIEECSYNDLVQEGILGVIESVDLFNPSMGYRFSTFAAYRIKNRINLYLRKNLSPFYIPRKKSYEIIRLKKNDKTSVESIKEDLNCGDTKAERLHNYNFNSISEEYIARANAPGDVFLFDGVGDLEMLEEDEKEIINLRYEKNLSWRKISTLTGLSYEGARKKHMRIINKIKGLILEKI